MSYALHPNLGFHDEGSPRHFVPEGWEDLDRGICPCGETVAWDETTETWQLDVDLRVLVLTPPEIEAIYYTFGRAGITDGPTFEMIDRQMIVQQPMEIVE